MKKRHTFKCWNCGKEYTLLRDFVAGQVLNVACPFCHAEGVVDLNPYTTTTVFRGTDSEDKSPPGLDLPEVLPTRPVPPKE